MHSLREFAKLSGFSRSTVSRVFTGKGKVSETTRRKILKLAAEINFRPCAVVAPSSTGMTKSIGIISHSPTISYFASVIEGLQDVFIGYGILPIMLFIRTRKNFKPFFYRLIAFNFLTSTDWLS